MDDVNEFEEMVWQSVQPVPSTEYVVLSAEQIAGYNVDFDAFMRRRFMDVWDQSEETKELTDTLFAGTGHTFVRVARIQDTLGTHPIAGNGLVTYIIATPEAAAHMFEVYQAIVRQTPLH